MTKRLFHDQRYYSVYCGFGKKYINPKRHINTKYLSFQSFVVRSGGSNSPFQVMFLAVSLATFCANNVLIVMVTYCANLYGLVYCSALG